MNLPNVVFSQNILKLFFKLGYKLLIKFMLSDARTIMAQLFILLRDLHT